MGTKKFDDSDERYTYADYAKWDDQRCELIDGKPYLMVMDGASFAHQRISVNFCVLLGSFLKGKSCKVFHAPFDVRLNFNTADNNVFQPDIMVVCDPSKLDDKGIKGAPEMVVEIVSPSSSKKDMFLKYQRYQKYGVGEYWIVFPEEKIVHVHLLKDGEYRVTAYGDDNEIPVNTLEGLKMSIADIFAD